MRLLLLVLVIPACVAPQAHTFEVAELQIELEEGQKQVGFELVLDIREGAMPDPELYEWDSMYVDVTLRGNIELEVMLGNQPKPKKGGRARGGRIFELNDIAANCSVEAACQRVVTVDIRRKRIEADTLSVWADFGLFSTQATVNAFPNTATEQEIRLRAFER